MPAYFKLIYKQTKDEADFNAVNKDIYLLLGYEYDDKKWCRLMSKVVDGIDWYNILGPCLAMGMSFEEIRNHIGEPTNEGKELHDNLLKVINYLETNYEIDYGRRF